MSQSNQSHGKGTADDIDITIEDNNVLLTLRPRCFVCKTELNSSTLYVIKDTLVGSPTQGHVMGASYGCTNCKTKKVTTYTVKDYADALLKVRQMCEERGIGKINLMTNFPK